MTIAVRKISNELSSNETRIEGELMRHRIAAITGLGNPNPVLLDNKGKLNYKFADAVVETYFPEGFDYKIMRDQVLVGIEPSYQFDPLKIVAIHKDKKKSFIQTGRAWGGYGSQLSTTTKCYSEYKYKSKFVKFIDQWHDKLFGGK